MAARTRVVILAQELLGIEDEERLGEIEEIAGLLGWMSGGIIALQDSSPVEPSPAIQFVPGSGAPEYWPEVADEP
jgi:hypothetical protein